MNIAGAVEIVALFFDLKMEFSGQFPRVEERTLAKLKDLRDKLEDDPPGTPYDSLRNRFMQEIDVMLSMVPGTLAKTCKPSTNEYTRETILIEKGEE